MGPLLLIPWFKAEPIYVPLPFPIVGLESIPLQPFGMLVAAGVLLGVRIAEEFARRNDLRPDVATDFATHTIASGFVGAVFLNAVFYNREWFTKILDGQLSFPGLSSYGGFFGAMAGVFIWKARRNTPVMAVIDSGAFALPFGWLFGRMGCFVVHDHPGRVSDFFLAVADYEVRGSHPPFPARHDLGLYEVIWSALVVLLFLYLARKPRPGGTYVSLLITLYAPVRFFLDFLRAEAVEGGDERWAGLTPGQYSSIVFLIIGLLMLRKVLTEAPAVLPLHVRISAVEAAGDASGDEAADEKSAPRKSQAAPKKPKKKR